MYLYLIGNVNFDPLDKVLFNFSSLVTVFPLKQISNLWPVCVFLRVKIGNLLRALAVESCLGLNPANLKNLGKFTNL